MSRSLPSVSAPHDVLYFPAQERSIELGLQADDPPEWALEDLRGKIKVERLDIFRRVSHCERAGNNGAGRSPTNEIEPMAEMNRPIQVFGKHDLYLLEERHGNCATHAAAIEREEPLGTGTEQVAIPLAPTGAGGACNGRGAIR